MLCRNLVLIRISGQPRYSVFYKIREVPLYSLGVTQRVLPRTVYEYAYKYRIIKYATFRGMTTVLGFCLLLVWVDQFNYSKTWGNLAVSLPGIVIGFVLAAFLIWGDCETSKRQSGSMYFFCEVCFILASQTAYVLLVSNDLTWWQAKGSLILTLGPLSYLINHLIIFRMRGDSYKSAQEGSA